MSIGGDDGITLHKITNVPTLIAKKTRHMDPDSLEMLDLDPNLDPHTLSKTHFFVSEVFCL